MLSLIRLANRHAKIVEVVGLAVDVERRVAGVAAEADGVERASREQAGSLP